MERMIRKQVYIKPEQERYLKSLSIKTGVTEAELIRRSIDGLAEHEEEWITRRAAWQDFVGWARSEQSQGPRADRSRDWTRDDLHDR